MKFFSKYLLLVAIVWLVSENSYAQETSSLRGTWRYAENEQAARLSFSGDNRFLYHSEKQDTIDRFRYYHIDSTGATGRLLIVDEDGMRLFDLEEGKDGLKISMKRASELFVEYEVSGDRGTLRLPSGRTLELKRTSIKPITEFKATD